MSGSESEQVPKTQAAPSGGPPKPPKKTARGLEDGSGGRDPNADIVERLIAEFDRRLLDPNLSAPDRAKFQQCLAAVQALQGKGE